MRLDLFRTRSLPFLSRRNFVIEMEHLMLWGAFAGLVEGNVCSVVAAKTFHGDALLITVVSATPMFANLVSLVWGVLSRGRRKLHLLLALGAAAVAAVASIGATPQTYWGGWVFAAQIALARVFLSGVVTVRTALWRGNYPQTAMGRVTARLQTMRASIGLLAITGAGLLFDVRHEAYRWAYPVAALIGFVALLRLKPIRVRGERAELRDLALRDAASRAQRRGFPHELSPSHMLREMARVLREDRVFARYCSAQMFLGTSNMLIAPAVVILVTRRLQLSYFQSNVMLDVIPQTMLIASLAFWARLFDNVGVLRFRVVNASTWMISIVLVSIAAYVARGRAPLPPESMWTCLWLFAVGRVITGLAMGGGAIAWNIGHLHFARDEDAELYMGVHVSLTGLRGLIAPFVGAWLYVAADFWAFIVASGVAVVGLAQFWALARDHRLANIARPE